MSKTSDWKIVATEGATVDGRAVTTNWIKDMAQLYSLDEYTALIWPEHSRSRWDKYEGKNWGTVEDIKAEKRAGKLRLLAKITPNAHLLKANAEGQKLFTSIEPNPDYKGEGRCYLMGLAVTDSPASTGTTRLKFSKGSGEECSHEYSELEEIDFSECVTLNPLAKAFSTIAHFFETGGKLPALEAEPQPQEDETMDKEQFATLMGKLNTIEEKQSALEGNQTEFAKQLKKPAANTDDEPNVADDKDKPKPTASAGVTTEQFSELMGKVDNVLTKQGELDTQFSALKKEVPGQRNAGEGADDDNKVEAV